MPAAHVVVVGAVNVDLVVPAPRLPGPGETVLGATVERHGGGKGANAAVAAARAGATVHLVAAVGADDTGAAALADLRAEGVDVDAVAVLDGMPTGVALIVVDPAGENQIAVAAGANAALAADHVHEALDRLLPGAGCVLVSAEIAGPALLAAVGRAVAAGVPCVLNPAPVGDAVHAAVGSGAVLTPNETELRQLAHAATADDAGPGRPDGDVTTAARALAGRSGAAVVVTAGARGAVIVESAAGPVCAVAAPAATEVVDTTGAGDTFNGTLAARLAAGDRLEDAVRYGVVAASLSVGRLGARSAMPAASEIAAALGR
ncbi:MAG: PfkB family carbohydrate kinase [Acidimicrobiia bacterium]